MIKNVVILLMFFCISLAVLSCSGNNGNLVVSFNAVNPLDIPRNDEVISIPLGSLDYKKDAKSLYCVADGEIVPTQLVDENGDETLDALLILISFEPNEKVDVNIFSSDSAKIQFKSRVNIADESPWGTPF